MNWRQRILATGIFCLVLGLGAAMAQEDSVLQRYDLAIENLRIAVESVPGDGVQARDELERALNALLTLSRDATSVSLVQAMERTFERARTAVENQSRTDIAVQVAVLEGGFRRLVMDSAFTAAAQDDLELARTRLAHLADAMAFRAEDGAALAAASDATGLRLAFEAGTADAIAAQVQVAERLMTEDRDAGYVALAGAYGDSLAIQDSPRTDAALNQYLVAAAQAVVDADDDALSSSLEGANLALVRLASAARGGLDRVEGAAIAPEASAPSELPSVGPAQIDVATPDTTEPAETTPVPPAALATDQAQAPETTETTPAAAAPTDAGLPDATAAVAGAPQDAELDAALADPLVAAAVERALAQARDEARAVAIADWTTTLRSAGIAEAQAGRQAAALVDAGFGSVQDVTDVLAADAGRAVAALRVGDDAGARAYVSDVAAVYRGSVAGLLQARDASVASDTEEILASLAERPSLREHDLTLLAAQVDAVERALSGSSQAAGLAFERTVDGLWSTWTRLGVLLVLGVLAVVQLVLLNMAFGGGNRNWRLVGWALLLLVVPIFYEALVALGSILADVLAMPELELLGRWSMFRSTTGQVVWAVLGFVGLLLATIGLRGICVQFGLLGRGRNSAKATATASATDTTRATGATAVDWDEEF